MHVLLLCTGGTIAGRGDGSTDLHAYTAGALPGTALVEAVPELMALAEITVEQVANVDSADLLFRHWQHLHQRLRDALADRDRFDAVVITHGTNTLEETAWLLQLLIDDLRPIVLVGAMRPATALSADGPLNLFQAVQTAVSPAAIGHGVLVVMDGAIHGARHVTKVATQGIGAFSSREAAPLGWVDDAGVHLPEPPASVASAPFAALTSLERWPQVAIVYGCVEPPAQLLPLLLQAGVNGLVFTGTGAGQLSVVERRALEAWSGELPLMLRANRCGAGPVHQSDVDAALGLLPAGTLSPQKARVLLLLALMMGWDRPTLAEWLSASPR